MFDFLVFILVSVLRFHFYFSVLNCFHNFILLLVCVFAVFIKEFIHVLFKVLNYFIITLLKTSNCGSAKIALLRTFGMLQRCRG